MMKFTCDTCGASSPDSAFRCVCDQQKLAEEAKQTIHGIVPGVTPGFPDQEAGGAHYGKSLQPWDLQEHMPSSGIASVDGRRCDAIKYSFRMKGDLKKLLDDLKKARHCLDSEISRLEEETAPPARDMRFKGPDQPVCPGQGSDESTSCSSNQE